MISCPKPRHFALWLLILFVLIVPAVYLTGCDLDNNEETDNSDDNGDAAIVEVEIIEKEILADTVRESGEVAPARQAVIVPAIPGNVEKVAAQEGDILNKDDLIFEVENTEQDLQQSQARSALESLEEEREKIKKLYEADALPASQLREIDTEIEQMEIQKEMAEYAFDATQTEAPFDGLLTDLDVEEGQMVGTEPVGRIMNLETAKVQMMVDEGLVGYLSTGMEAQVEVSAADLETSGEIVKVGDAAIEGTRSYLVEVEMENPENQLRPGMFARVFFDLEEREGFQVHSSALTEQEDRVTMFVVENGRARQREVITGARQDGMVEITEGLQEGEKYIISPPAGLEDGSPVEYKDINTTSGEAS